MPLSRVIVLVLVQVLIEINARQRKLGSIHLQLRADTMRIIALRMA